MSSTYTSTTYDPANMDINDPAYNAANTTYGTSSTDWDTSTSPTDYTSPDYTISSTTAPSSSLVTNPSSSSNYNLGYNEGYNDALGTSTSTTSTARNPLRSSTRYGDLTSGLASTYDDTTTYTSDDVRVNTGTLGGRTGLDTGLYGSRGTSGWGQGSLSSKPSSGWRGAARRMASRF